jgi:hypothetical protein
MLRARPSLLRWGFTAAVLLVGAETIPACGSSAGTSTDANPPASKRDAGSHGGGSGDGGTTTHLGNRDGAADVSSLGSDTGADGGFCAQTGPTVQLPGSGGMYSVCTAQIAATLFENALCTCTNTQVAGYLQTTGFNSTTGAPAGAAVGINNDYKISAGYTHVGGSLSIAGPDSVAFFGYVEADGDLRLEGTSSIPGYTKVHRNGWLASKFTDLGPADFSGDLHHAGQVVAIPLSVGGSNVSGAVSIPPPCPCQPSNILDVPAIVSQGQAQNDDAMIGLSPSAWVNLLVDQTITLPCGRYYLDSIQIGGKLIMNVTGRVALFIGADVTVIGELQILLDSTAQIDIFIENDLDLVGYAVFGDANRPAATRIYVGGAGNINLIGAAGFVGNLYAPKSTVTAPGYLDVHGAVFANNFQIPGYADFNYDAAITEVGNNCSPVMPPGGCSQCGQCTNGEACVGGKCGACTQDSDCCGQDVCVGGACEGLLK